MISKDMKYTALYWALGFEEVDLDIYRKIYPKAQIVIDAEKQTVNYRGGIVVLSDACGFLERHKDFVILECLDRLLKKGYAPEDVVVDGRTGCPDIHLKGADIICEQWGTDYWDKLKNFYPKKGIVILYTSRLVSGLLEYKNCISCDGELWDKGIFEEEIQPYKWNFSRYKTKTFPSAEQKGFQIFEKELLFYSGTDKHVVVPEGITSIAASAFWNNTHIEEVELPQSLEKLGGDCFYYCKNLKKVNIPKNVHIMGDNPFAGCPGLKLTNESPYFRLQDGVLYNRAKTSIIYYPINKSAGEFIIPDGVKIVGKHSFFACNNLRKIIIPYSVTLLKNNPFSGCERLEVENHSPNYIFDSGVIYNKYLTSVIGCLNGTEADELILPKTLTSINRNSFWNCKNIKKLMIPKSVVRIGYNPFAGCEKMMLYGNPTGYQIQDGIIFSRDKSALCCATDSAVGEKYVVPDSVGIIGRGAFSGCKSLKKINLNQVTYIDKSAFTNCSSLETVFIPDSTAYIGEWVFAYCINLRQVSIKRGTSVDRNAFNECPAEIIWRD